jgi:hypothetical protein
MCEHQLTGPDAMAPDPLAARVVVSHPEQGWGRLLLPDGRSVVPSPPRLAACPRVSPAGRMVVTDTKKIKRAMENTAYLHMLLLEKDPGFLEALELAVNRVDRELSGARPEAA